MKIGCIPEMEGFFRRYKFLADGKPVMCLNSAPPEESYWLRQKRPSIHPLLTPSGVPVTEQGGHTMSHHKAVWIAHADINGANFYTDEGNTGLIQTVKADFREDGNDGVMDTRIIWNTLEGKTLLEERRVMRIIAGKRANRVDIHSSITTPLDHAVLAREKHAFFHVRVIDVMSEDQGGVVTASNGVIGTEKIYGTDGFWIDTRGRVGAASAGVAIMVHRRQGPQPLFSRSYGTVALNQFMREGLVLKRGEKHENLYSVVAYDDADSFDVPAVYEAFCASGDSFASPAG